MGTPDEAAEPSHWLLYSLPVLLAAQAAVPAMVNKVVQTLSPVTAAERERAGEIRRLRAEQKGISMMDNFAKYAKIDRRVIKIKEELKALGSTRLEEQKSARRAFNLTLYGLLGLVYFLLLANFSRTPVAVLGGGTTAPLGWLVALPCSSTGGAVGLAFWAMCCRQTLGAMSKMIVGS